jgi:hypothetical protein
MLIFCIEKITNLQCSYKHFLNPQLFRTDSVFHHVPRSVFFHMLYFVKMSWSAFSSIIVTGKVKKWYRICPLYAFCNNFLGINWIRYIVLGIRSCLYLLVLFLCFTNQTNQTKYHIVEDQIIIFKTSNILFINNEKFAKCEGCFNKVAPRTRNWYKPLIK